jgi:urease accessory protein UreH
MDSTGTAFRGVDHPRVSLAEVGRRGRMSVTFVLQDGRTAIQEAYCEIPFKITRTLGARAPVAHLMLMHCSPGLFGGDDVSCSIHIKAGARVLITQQSATRIHPSQGRQALQTHEVFVDAGAELRLYLEPIIPFADSSLSQTTRIHVQPGARLAYWEGFMAGRVGRGERWRFRQLASETDLRVNGRSVYLERFRLPNGTERSDYAMGQCDYWGTGLYVGEQAVPLAERLHDARPEAGVDVPAPNVAVARVVSASGPDFHRSRQIFEGLHHI